MIGYLLVVTLATRTTLNVHNIAYTYLLPLIAMFTSFLFNVSLFSTFHVSVLIKPLLLFFYVVFFFSLLVKCFNEKDNYIIKNTLNLIFIIQLIIILLQIIFGDVAALKVLSFKEVYSGFGFRAPGTFDWVYVTCYFLSFFLGLHIIGFYLGDKKKSSGIYILLSLIAIFLSQSKTGYLATVIISLYFVFLSLLLRLKIANKIITVMLIALTLLTLCIIYLGLNLDYITTFIDLVQQGRLDGSTSTRKKQTLLALNEGFRYWYSGSPLALKGMIIENSYFDYLFRYGLAGLITFLLIIFTLYFYSLRVCINTKRLLDRGCVSFDTFQLSVACHVSMFAASIYSFSGTPLDGYRSAIWSCFVIALVAYINYKSREAANFSR